MSDGEGRPDVGRAARPAISGDKGRTNLSTAALVSMYRTMYTIRRFEQRSLDLHKQGRFAGPGFIRTSVRRPLPSACAPPSGLMTSSPAHIEATGMPSPKEPTSEG